MKCSRRDAGDAEFLKRTLSQRTLPLGESLLLFRICEMKLDPETAHILDDAEAMKMWDREYEPGWEPQV